MVTKTESIEQAADQPTNLRSSHVQVSILRLAGTLVVVATVSAAVLAAAHELTRDRIEAARARMKRSGVLKILPRCANDPVKDAIQLRDTRGSTINVFRCRRKVDGTQTIAAIAMELDSANNMDRPYSGLIRVAVSIDVGTGRIRSFRTKKGPEVGVVILKHSETPGLGSKIEEYAFRKMFAGKDLRGTDRTSEGRKWAVKKDDPALGFVDAISGATISSRAVAELVRRALALYHRKRQRILAGKATGLIKGRPSGKPGAALVIAMPPLLRPPRVRRVKIKQAHLAKVLPKCANDPLLDKAQVKQKRGRYLTAYRCRQKQFNGQLTVAAVAIEIDTLANRHQPYETTIHALVGIDTTTGRIRANTSGKGRGTGVHILFHSETEDMGSQVAETDFLKNYNGKDLTVNGSTSKGEKWIVNTEKQQGGVVDALSGATISSMAITELVRRALEVWLDNRQVILGSTPP